jgi:hypothetical protein
MWGASMATFAGSLQLAHKGRVKSYPKNTKSADLPGAWSQKQQKPLYHTLRKSQGVGENILDNFLESAYLRAQ